MQRYMPHLCEGADRRTHSFMQAQVLDPNSLQYGGIRGDIWEAKPTVYALATALAAYLNPGCSHFESGELLRAMKLAAAFVERTQRDDGSFDYPSCNFHSAPDTSFCFKRLIAGYRLMTGAGPRGRNWRNCGIAFAGSCGGPCLPSGTAASTRRTTAGPLPPPFCRGRTCLHRRKRLRKACVPGPGSILRRGSTAMRTANMPSAPPAITTPLSITLCLPCGRRQETIFISAACAGISP